MLADAGCVVHLAAETGTAQSMYEISRYTATNVGGTASLLNYLANNRHQVAKIVLTSSRSVYGEGAYHCDRCGVVFPSMRSVEMLRCYGVLLTILLLCCLLYPLRCLALPSRRAEHFLYLGYAFYLVLCVADPFLVSSSGMLMLSIIVAKAFSVPQCPKGAASLAEASSAARPI